MRYHMGDSDIYMLTFDLLKLHNYVLHHYKKKEEKVKIGT